MAVSLRTGWRRAHTRTLATTLIAAATLAAIACGKDSLTGARPVLPSEPKINPTFQNAAFIFDVDMTRRVVRVTSPSKSVLSPSVVGGPSLSTQGGDGGPSMSILAGDVVELITSGYTASGVGTGGAPAGKVRVSFDVQITNKLTGVELITPTFPTPPAGATGPLLFPFSTVTTTTSGGVSVGGDGTEIIVELPSSGLVEPFTGWDGAPHNFFNDVGCAAGSNDCYRYEQYPTIPAGGTTVPSRVDFILDPTVNRFRARLIVAADLRSAVLATGTISGNVSSTELGGPVAGVTVSAGGSFTATSDASGNYTIPNVNVGSRTVTVTGGLPAGCSATPVSVTVTNGGTSTANFPLSGCTVPTGTVTGTIIRSNDSAPISGVGVSFTPAGGSATAPVNTNASGAFSASVPTQAASNGSIAYSNVPSNCTIGSAPTTYTGLTTGGTVALGTITFSCTTPVVRHTYSSSWAAGTADTVELTMRIDLGPPPGNLDNNGSGADQLSGITIDVLYDNVKLAPATGGSASQSLNPELNSRAYNPALSPNSVRIALFSLDGFVTSGNVALAKIKFVYRPGQTGGFSHTSSINQASGPSPGLIDLVPRIDVVDTPRP